MTHAREMEWTAHAEWMRTHGATKASWDPSGALIALELGPMYPAPSEDGTSQSEGSSDPKPAREVPRSAGARLVRRAE